MWYNGGNFLTLYRKVVRDVTPWDELDLKFDLSTEAAEFLKRSGHTLKGSDAAGWLHVDGGKYVLTKGAKKWIKEHWEDFKFDA